MIRQVGLSVVLIPCCYCGDQAEAALVKVDEDEKVLEIVSTACKTHRYRFRLTEGEQAELGTILSDMKELGEKQS